MTNQERKLAIKIITEAFDDNPMISHIIGEGPRRAAKLKALAAYSIDWSIRRNGAYFSSDNTGLALCYQFNHHSNKISDLWAQIRLVHTVIGWQNIKSASIRESYRKQIRPTNEDYLYFWYLGVSKEGVGGNAVRELRDLIFEKSKSLGLPIYMETTLLKNKKVYERYGFETFHEWVVPGTSITMWFMKKEP